MPTPIPWSARLAALDDGERKRRIAHQHPLYEQHIESWTTLLHAYEGTGGFLDGDYLWPYPAEEHADWSRRRQQARYHNFARPLVDLYVRYLFARGVARNTTNADLAAWWDDIDGQGTSLGVIMRRALRHALVTGHCGLLVDRDRLPPTGPSLAEEQAAILCTLYPAASIVDWRERYDTLVEVKLQEEAPPGDLLAKPLDEDEARRFLLWDEWAWARVDPDGLVLTDEDGQPMEGLPELGVMPLVLVRPLRSPTYPAIGRSVIGDPQVHRALYNRCSEEDEVLRAQAFSVFTVEVPSDGRVEEVKNQLGSSIGTAKAVVVQGAAKYITPEMAVPEAIRANAQWLIREIYRAAHIPYAIDSREAESGEAIRLKYQELNEVLTELAAEAERVEQRIARVWCAWQAPTPEAGAALYDAANVVVQYPREFFIADFAAELERWASAIAMRLGSTYEAQIRKHIVRLMSPDLSQAQLDAIDAEIEAQPTNAEMAPAAAVETRARERAQALIDAES